MDSANPSILHALFSKRSNQSVVWMGKLINIQSILFLTLETLLKSSHVSINTSHLLTTSWKSRDLVTNYTFKVIFTNLMWHDDIVCNDFDFCKIVFWPRCRWRQCRDWPCPCLHGDDAGGFTVHNATNSRNGSSCKHLPEFADNLMLPVHLVSVV